MLVDRFVRHLPALKADADDLIQWYSTVANCGGASKNERLDRERKKRKKNNGSGRENKTAKNNFDAQSLCSTTSRNLSQTNWTKFMA